MSSETKKRKLANDDAGGKRRRISTEEQLNNGDTTNFLFNLPDDVMQRVISFITISQWPALETVNRQFQRGVILAWRTVRDVRLEELTNTKKIIQKGAFDRRKILSTLLDMLVKRSPMIRSLSGFSKFVQSFDHRSCHTLAQFEHLQIVDFTDCHIPVRNLAHFLATSSSRDVLHQLHLARSLRFISVVSVDAIDEKWRIHDGLLRDAVMNVPDRPLLKLKALYYQDNDSCGGEFFEALDVSELETLHLGQSELRPSALASLLSRCTNLKNLDLGMSRFRSFPLDTSGSVNRSVLDAVASLSSRTLRSLNLDGLPRCNFIKQVDVLDSFLTGISQCTNVRKLSLLDWTCIITGDNMVNIITTKFANVEELALEVSRCYDTAIVRLLASLPRLKTLVLESHKPILPMNPMNRHVINAIISHQPRLNSLKLPEFCGKPSVLIALDQLTELTSLRICGKHVTNETLLGWNPVFSSQLESLEIPDTAVSDAGTAVAVKNMSSLRRLSLQGTNITDVTLRVIASSCSVLQEINLCRCKKITERGVQALMDGCGNLERIRLVKTSIERQRLALPKRKIRFT